MGNFSTPGSSLGHEEPTQSDDGIALGEDALGEEIVPPSPPPLLRPSPRPTHSVRSEGGRSGSPDSANLRGTLRREEERVTLEEEELRRRAEEERARQPPPAEPEPAWTPSLEERLAAILAAGLQRDPKGFTLPKAPEEFSAYTTWRLSINSSLLSSGGDPVSTLRFITEHGAG